MFWNRLALMMKSSSLSYFGFPPSVLIYIDTGGVLGLLHVFGCVFGAHNHNQCKMYLYQ